MAQFVKLTDKTGKARWYNSNDIKYFAENGNEVSIVFQGYTTGTTFREHIQDLIDQLNSDSVTPSVIRL